jgi:DNA-binding MarR family transcriptional regulator
VNARLTLAQTTLAKKLGISRQGVEKLVSRLEQAGWIAHHQQQARRRNQQQLGVEGGAVAEAARGDAGEVSPQQKAKE